MKRIAFISCRATALLAVAPLLTGCSEGVSGERHVDDLPRFGLVEELRIGSVDDPDVGFSHVGDVRTGDDGLLYVLERAEKEIRVYDHGGSLVRRFGGGGRGPGEFEFPVRLGLLGDTVWVLDLRLQRLSLFSRDGRFINSYSPPPIPLELGPGVHVTLRAVGLASDGTLTSGWAVAVQRDPPTDTFQIPLVRMDTSGAILDTILSVPFSFPPRTTITVGGRSMALPGAPLSDPIHTRGPDGGTFLIERPVASDADAAEFTVHRIDAAGDTTYSRAYRYRPRAWDEAAIDSLVARNVRAVQGPGVDPDAVSAEARKAIVLPAFQPGLSTVRAGSDGSLWIRVEDAASDRVQWIVIDADGIARGTLALPRRATIHQVSGDVLWLVEPDDMDVPWLVRYRIGPADAREPDRSG